MPHWLTGVGVGLAMPWLPSQSLLEINQDANATLIPDFDPPKPYLSSGKPPIGANVFVGDFETGDLSQWTGVEGVANDSIQVVESPVRAGKYAGRFKLRPGEFLHHGNRAELTHNLGDPPGSEGWYAWSIYIPEKGYQDDPDPSHWQILAQFHDQPNADLGWGWENFPPHNSSIALYYLSHPQRAIGLGVGLNLPKGTITHGTAPISKDKWVDILFHIGWSTGDDGFVGAWVDGASLTGTQPAKGRTLYYAYSDYHKLGIYRDPNSTSTVELYLDEFRTGPTRESVQVPKGRARRRVFRA